MNTVCSEPSSAEVLTPNYDRTLAGGRRWLFSAALAVAFVALCYFVGGLPVFETNDDVYMSMLSAGKAVAPLPDDHLSYLHHFLGKWLVMLNSLRSDVPWYGWTFLFAQLCSMTVMVRVLSAKVGGKTGYFFAFVFLLFSCVRPVLFMQFTSTASLIASAGALIILLSAERGNSLKFKYVLPSIALIAVGALIRCESAKLVVILTLVAIVARFAFRKEFRKFFLAAASSVVALSAVLALEFNQRSYYSQSEWRNFYPLLSACYPIVNRPVPWESRKIQAACDAVGWTAQDLALFKDWYMTDEELFSIEKLNRFRLALPQISPYANFSDIRTFVSEFVADWSVMPQFIGLFAVQFIIARRRFSLLASAFFSACATAIITLLFLFLYVPPRVYSSIFQFMLLVFFLYASPGIISRWRHKVTDSGSIIPLVSVCILLIALMTPILFGFRPHLAAASIKAASLKEAMSRLNPKASDLYLNWATAFPLPVIRPFDNLDGYFTNFNMAWYGSSLRNPVLANQLQIFGLPPNPLAYLEKSNIYLIANEEHCGWIEPFVVQRYGKVPIFETVFHEPELNFDIYSVHFVAADKCPNTDLSISCPDLGIDDAVLPPIGKKDWRRVGLQVHVLKNNKASIKTRDRIAYLRPRKKLAIPAKSTTHFIVEAAADPWMNTRVLHVVLELNEREPKRFQIALLPDKALHRYAFDLRDLSLKDSDVITSMQLHPLSWFPPKGSKCAFGKVGFKLTLAK